MEHCGPVLAGVIKGKGSGETHSKVTVPLCRALYLRQEWDVRGEGGRQMGAVKQMRGVVFGFYIFF